MPLARGPRAYTRNYCYVYRRYGETEREREKVLLEKGAAQGGHTSIRGKRRTLVLS